MEPSRRRRSALPEDGLGPQSRQRLLAVFRVGSLEDQYTVEMVEFVLNNTSSERVELPPDILALRILAFERDPHGACNRDAHALQREAPLVLGLALVRALDDPRIDDGARPLLVRFEDKEPPEHTDLGRGEADTLRVAHQRGHPLDKTPKVVLEVHDLVRRQPERRVGILADLSERQPSTCVSLGVELVSVAHLAVLAAGP